MALLSEQPQKPNLHVILVAYLAGTASQCKTFFSFAGGKSPHSPA